MILLHTFIGYGTSNQGSSKTHGAPLKKEDYEASEERFVKGYLPFHVDEDVYQDLKDSFAKRGEEAFEAYEAEKKNNRGVLKPICKLKFKMQTAVREDLLRYLQSGKTMEEK